MALNNNNTQSYGKLQQFIHQLHKPDIDYRVDPYNTFLCQIDMVDPITKRPWSDILSGLHVPIDPNFDPNSGLLNKDIHALIEDITIPKISSAGNSESLLHGKYQTFTTYPLMTDGTFSIKFLNTAPNPIIESVIYPWMKDCSLGFNENPSLEDLNYPRADLTIIFPHLYIDSGLNAEQMAAIPYYKYFNIRPINIEMYSPSNKPAQSMYRSAVFAFDYFAVLDSRESYMQALAKVKAVAASVKGLFGRSS